MASATKSAPARPSRDETANALLDGQEVSELSAATPVESSESSTESSSPAAPEQVNTSELATTPGATSATETAPVLSPFMQQVSELGFVDVKDENEARERLVQSYRTQAEQQAAYQQQMAEMQQYALYGQQYLQQLQDPSYQQFVAQRQQPRQQPGAAEADKWWSPPTFDESWINKYREVTPEGQVRWKDGTPADVRANAESYQSYIEKWSNDLVTRPHEVLPKIIREEARKLFEEQFQQVREVESVQTFAHHVQQQNAGWLYAKDPRTQDVMRDQMTGQPYYSPEGQMAMQFVKNAQDIGISDPQNQWEYATLKLQSYLSQNQQMQQASSQASAATIQDNKLALLKKGAGHIASRGGSEPLAETSKPRSQNPHLSPGHKLLGDLQRDGVV